MKTIPFALMLILLSPATLFAQSSNEAHTLSAKFRDCSILLLGSLSRIEDSERKSLIEKATSLLHGLGYPNVCLSHPFDLSQAATPQTVEEQSEEIQAYSLLPVAYINFGDMTYDLGWFVAADFSNEKESIRYSSKSGKFFKSKTRALKKFEEMILERVPPVVTSANANRIESPDHTFIKAICDKDCANFHFSIFDPQGALLWEGATLIRSQFDSTLKAMWRKISRSANQYEFTKNLSEQVSEAASANPWDSDSGPTVLIAVAVPFGAVVDTLMVPVRFFDGRKHRNYLQNELQQLGDSFEQKIELSEEDFQAMVEVVKANFSVRKP